MPLPAILASMALDPIIDLADTGIDFVTLLQNEIIVKQNQDTQTILCFDMLMSIFQMIDSKITDIENDYEISKLQAALYNPKILNKLLGDALNFGSEKPVIKFVDSPFDFDVPFWLQWAEDIWFDYTNLSQDRYDFSSFLEFYGKKSDGSDDVDRKFYLSRELVKFLQLDFLYNF